MLLGKVGKIPNEQILVIHLGYGDFGTDFKCRAFKECFRVSKFHYSKI